MPGRLPPDGIPDWNRVDRSGWPDDILDELPGPDDERGMTVAELAARLDLVPYERDARLRPGLNRLRDQGLVERVDNNSRWQRWRRAKKWRGAAS